MKKFFKKLTVFVIVHCTLSIVHCFAQQDSTLHLNFMNIPIQGDITDFTESMRPRYKLQKKVGDENYYIYRGPFYGHEVYMKAEYTRKSRTVYRVTVTPKHIDQNALLDSLVVHHGAPQETKTGYGWSTPEGIIMLQLPQGYDPIVMYIDRKGAAVFQEEK